MFSLSRALLLAGVCALPAAAVPLTVNNPRFEADILADGDATCNGVTGFTNWNSIDGSCGTGLFNPTASHFTGGVVPAGVNVVYLNDPSYGYWQALGDTFTQGMYTFGVEIGHRLDEPYLGFTLELRAGATYATSTLLATLRPWTVPPCRNPAPTLYSGRAWPRAASCARGIPSAYDRERQRHVRRTAANV